jgi:hypothetical protein
VKVKSILLFFALTMTVTKLFAQPGDPSVDPDVPITGIEILIGLGGALGIRKLIMAKRNNASEK